MVFKRDLPDRSVYFAYFLELERSRQRKEISQDKLKRYNEYCKRGSQNHHNNFGFPVSLIRILFVSANENEMNKLMEHTGHVATPDIQAVLYSTYEQVLSDPYGPIWKAKGMDPHKRFALHQSVK